MPANKKVLVIAYFFPPIGGGGIQRTIKFVKYLPDFNWEPIILTVKDGLWISKDNSLSKTIPENLKIYRTKCFGIKTYFKYVKKNKYDNIPKKINPIGYILQIIFNLILPDFAIGWYYYTVKIGEEIIQSNDIDLIYTTSPPFSEHLIGWILKKKTKKKWIADFRDSFVSDPNLSNDLVGFAQRFTRKIYEKIIISNSDLIITATDPIRQDLLDRYQGKLSECEIITITNGFDRDDFKNLQKINHKNKKMTITYTGTFQGKQTAFYFIESLKSAIKENKNLMNDIHIRFIGEFSHYDKELFSDDEIKDVIEIIEYVPYEKSLAYQINSDVNLLIISVSKKEGGDQIFTGKIFEYIGAGKPIFGLVPDGIAKDLILTEKLGIVADPNNISDIKTKIMHIYELWKKDLLIMNSNPELFRVYERKELTRILADNFNKLINN